MGQIKVLDVIPSLATSRTKDMSNGGAPVSWKRALFLLDVESITPGAGSIDVNLRWLTSAGTVIAVTGATNVTTTGLFEFTIATLWTNDPGVDPLPEPTETVVTFNGDASEFSGRVYMFAA